MSTLASVKSRSYLRAHGFCIPQPSTGQRAMDKTPYVDRTARLVVLKEFTGQFGIWGLSGENGRLMDGLRDTGETPDPDTVSARNLAVLSCFHAIRRIAEGS